MANNEYHSDRSVHDAALDAVAELLRERAVGMPGALKPWATLSEDARSAWRAEAAIYLAALGHAGVGLFRRHHHAIAV